MADYRLIAHDQFVASYTAFKKQYPLVASSLDSKLKLIDQNPRGGGATTLSHIANPDLAGKLLRVWVKGNNGHRLIYFTDPECDFAIKPVCPLLITDPKTTWDYDKLGEDEILPIVDAYRAQRWSEFCFLNVLLAA